MNQLERLSRRISWLERFRRPLAILVAVAGTAVLVYAMKGWLPENWPTAHLVMIGLMIATVAWYGVETVLGFLLALWETEYSNLTKPAELPRAELLPHKRQLRK